LATAAFAETSHQNIIALSARRYVLMEALSQIIMGGSGETLQEKCCPVVHPEAEMPS
jgi:hypothetical protein